MYPYRVFISYSQKDHSLAREVETALTRVGLKPVWDPQIQPGERFTEQIKTLISHSHLFIPLITEHSYASPWVHQETGFAIALGVPVLPIAVDRLPGVMSAGVQALEVGTDLTDLADNLMQVDLGQLIGRNLRVPVSLVQVAGWPEERTRLMAELSTKVLELQGPARVRQRGTYSTFSIPKQAPENPVWNIRDGENRRSHYYHELQAMERLALEEHARHKGCDLIVNPNLRLRDRGRSATRVRLYELLKFLEASDITDINVAISSQEQPRNLTILGDWWIAESLVAGPGGYRQTVFNWHAPTALGALRDFDQEFMELSGGAPSDTSRSLAIELIRKEIETLDNKGTDPFTPAKTDDSE